MDDQSQKEVGEILRLESLCQMLLKQNTTILTFGKQIMYFANDSISIEVLALQSWIILVDPSLYENSHVITVY